MKATDNVVSAIEENLLEAMNILVDCLKQRSMMILI